MLFFNYSFCYVFFFFFQAEDGIRDRDVTGVQTCALPISLTHAGENEGYRCELEVYTEMGPGFAVMTNSDGGKPLIQELLRAVAKEYSWPDFQPLERAVAKIDPAILGATPGHIRTRTPAR